MRDNPILNKIIVFLFKRVFPKQYERYWENLTQILYEKVDKFIAFGDQALSFSEGGIVSEETLHLLQQTPSDPHFELHMEQEQESAAGDYLATFENMRDVLRENHDQWFAEMMQSPTPTYTHAINPKQHIMDRKYPHFCFECKNPLQYKHAFNQALRSEIGIILRECILTSSLSKEGIIHIMKEIKEVNQFKIQFKKWWKSPFVKFFCCMCYRKKTGKETTNDLDHLALSLPTVQEIDRCERSRCSIEFREDLDNNNYYEEP